jgi:hypothetical protein
LDPVHETLRDSIFALGTHIRYVAFASGQRVDTEQRDDVSNASDAVSDFYEELLVNPTLLTLARQRGDLDCGGLRYLIVAYGNFNQVIMELPEGHVSVCVALDADPVDVARRMSRLIGESTAG